MKTLTTAFLLMLASCGGSPEAPAAAAPEPQPASSQPATSQPTIAPSQSPLQAGDAVIHQLRQQKHHATEREKAFDSLLSAPR